ncbi:ADP-ribosylation factor [Thelohanellus kitauei]|uniref:ADP-ribosylation factor n=1 Tax=Thelohanellus kitauei TaxID=669202 RepID=A0A0C2MGZ9_THEKT|nr:ADP-ribosylation factor [Thelohanellus kitauei]
MYNVVLTGMAKSGKTTIMEYLKSRKRFRKYRQIDPGLEIAEYENMYLASIDLHKRSVGMDFMRLFQEMDAIILVIDSTDIDKMIEAKEFIQALVSRRNPKDLIVLVLANMQDLPRALNPSDIVPLLNFNELNLKRWVILPACTHMAVGIFQGLDWLSYKLKRCFK